MMSRLRMLWARVFGNRSKTYAVLTPFGGVQYVRDDTPIDWRHWIEQAQGYEGT